MSNEPNVAPGDQGEYVTLLQEQLQQLGYYESTVDGEYGPATEAAVRLLQEAVSHEQNGQVEEATWEAIAQQVELLDSGDYYQQDASEAEASEAEASEAEASEAEASGQWSEDGQWWWDGTAWQAADGQAKADDTAAVGDTAADQAGDPGQVLSPDGQWQWDGAQWVPTADAAALVGFPGDLQAGDLGDSLQAHQPLDLGAGQDGPGPTSSSTTDALTGFATGSAELTDEHRSVLERIAADLNAHPLHFGGYVTLTGFADRRGDEEANRDLGQRRADAVRDYLQQLVTDDETRAQIRAYSLGEADGPEGDVPSLRKVEIVITRRSYDLDMGPHPTPPLPGPFTPDTSIPDILRLPRQPIPEPDPSHPELPDWFWRELPPRPADPSFITQLSRWLNQTLHTDDIARVGADIAEAFGFDRARVKRMLDDAFQSGGEAAVKEILNEVIRRTAGSPSSPPNSPTGPAVNPIPFPTPQIQTPEIRF